MSNPEGSTLSAGAQSLLSYWRQSRGDALLPHRDFISPQKLRPWIGDVSVIHVHDGEKRFFVALYGENVVRHIGPGFNKKYLEDVVPRASLSLSIAPYLMGLEKRVPVYLTMQPDLSNGLVSTLTRLAFPFCDSDPESVDRFLVYVEPDKNNGEKDAMIYSSSCALRRSGDVPAPFPIHDGFNVDDVIPAVSLGSPADASPESTSQPRLKPRNRKSLWGGFLGALERG